MQEVHRVNDQGDIGGVLAGCVGNIHLRDNRLFRHDFQPGAHLRGGEITINSPDAGLANAGDFLEQLIREFRAGIICVNQNGKAGRAGLLGHGRHLVHAGVRPVPGRVTSSSSRSAVMPL